MSEHDMREGEMHASGIGMGGAAIAHTWTCQIGSKGQTKGHGPPVNHLKSLGSQKKPSRVNEPLVPFTQNHINIYNTKYMHLALSRLFHGGFNETNSMLESVDIGVR